jgi:hypothetical protein
VTSVSAQQTENKSFTDARVQATVEDGPTGTVVRIQNFNSQPITAYLVDLRQTMSPEQLKAAAEAQVKSVVARVHSEHLSDCITMPWAHGAIAPNEVDTFLAWPVSPSKMQRTIQLIAVIFADGTSAGEPESIARVLATRKMHWTHLTEILALMQEEQNKNAPVEKVLADLKAAREAKDPLTAATPDRDDWQIADGLYRVAILGINENLQSATPTDLHTLIGFRIREYTDDLKLLNSSNPPMNAAQ